MIQHPEDAYLSELATELLIRRGKVGYFPLGEQAYYEELSEHGGFTAENLGRASSRAGATMESLLAANAESDLLSLLHASGVEHIPLEAFLGKLSGSFRGQGHDTIHEYSQLIRKTGNPNVYTNVIGKPLLHFLLGQYLRTDRTIILDLIAEYLTLPGVDINMLDAHGRHVFDIFQVEEEILRNNGVILILEEAQADWAYSAYWRTREDGHHVHRVLSGEAGIRAYGLQGKILRGTSKIIDERG